MINKKIIILLITILLVLPLIQAQQQTSMIIANKITEEHVKTRNDLKQYCDHKTDLMVKTVETEGQEFIDENFRIFDKRIHDLAREFLIRFIIAVTASILLAQLLFYVIKRKIEKKELPRKRILAPDGLRPQEIKLTTKEYRKVREEEKELPTFEEHEYMTKKEIRQTEKQKKKIEEQRQKKLKQLKKQQEKLIKKIQKPKIKENDLIQQQKRIEEEIKKLERQNGNV